MEFGTRDERPGYGEGGSGSSSSERPSHERPSHERPSHERPSHERPSHERPSHERSSQERPSYERPPDERPHEPPSYERPPDERPHEPPSYERTSSGPSYERAGFERTRPAATRVPGEQLDLPDPAPRARRHVEPPAASELGDRARLWNPAPWERRRGPLAAALAAAAALLLLLLLGGDDAPVPGGEELPPTSEASEGLPDVASRSPETAPGAFGGETLSEALAAEAAGADGEAVSPRAVGEPDADPFEAAPAREPARPSTVGTAGKTAGFEIQLASMSSAEGAGEIWRGLSGAHPDLLGDLEPGVVATELEGHGTLHRLRAGPLADRESARRLCESLAARGVGCFVVDPTR